MNKKLVIAGTNDEAMSWIKNDISRLAQQEGSWRSISDYIIVHRTDQLRGLRNPTGIFVGRWKDRRDIIDILHTIYANTDPGEASHTVIGNLLAERMIP